MTKKGGGRPGDDILSELNSVSSLLGDAGRDVGPDGLDDNSVPLLKPESPADGAGSSEGDAHTQIPLLGSEDPDKPVAARDLKKELAARDNPFLPRKQMDELQKSRQQASDSMAGAPVAAPAPVPPSPSATPQPSLTDEQVKQAVDAAVAEWLPRLEADLRARLTKLLKS